MKKYLGIIQLYQQERTDNQLFSIKVQLSLHIKLLNLSLQIFLLIQFKSQIEILLSRNKTWNSSKLYIFRISRLIKSLIPFEKTFTCKQMYFFISVFYSHNYKSHSRRRWHSTFLFKNHCFPNSNSPNGVEGKKNSPGLYPTQKRTFSCISRVNCKNYSLIWISSFPYNDIYDYDILMKLNSNVFKILDVMLLLPYLAIPLIYNKKPIVRTILSSLLFIIQKYLEQFAKFTFKDQQNLGLFDRNDLNIVQFSSIIQ
ncbi:unnamed protein product (macronuclear) [Paramecium tetraurelia]|uniref:Transmembrane protein n=1 Tax=Paramecium tetraurelia TaxID=5888 RepID=A0BWB7_PARTE|nr:uncharacterized protein GSPATT00032686001 [Paramecium tetraurelia]CAK62834.1 unnamed protein product [Paramecium tetraurelia]|eukprot:XP_001430232.1 hypothetical protein (macronuclear) [Paramecium tetraurelia strain d4-2]